MMFTEALAVAIVKGEKRVTRRVLSDKPRSPWYRNQPAGKRYPVGKVFAVNPGRGVPRIAECEVTARYRQTLGAMLDADGCGWCEGSPAWTCTDCFGLGIEVSAAAKALIARVEGG